MTPPFCARRLSGRFRRLGAKWKPCASLGVLRAAFLPTAILTRSCWINRLNVEIGDAQRIFLDELPARFDDVAHQPGEDLVGHVGLLDFDLEQ